MKLGKVLARVRPGRRGAAMLAVAAGVIALALISYAIASDRLGTSGGMSSQTDDIATASDAAPYPGRRAPDFRITLLNDFDSRSELRLADLKGKGVVLNFWASWCPPCRVEMPAFQKVWEKYGQGDLVVVGVAVQDREEDSLEFMKKIGVTYPVGPDATGQIALDYKITSLPSTYFIDGRGQIARRWIGAIDEGRLETYALELLR